MTLNTPIKLYSNSWCPDSYRAKLIFTKNEIEFEEIDIERDPDGDNFVTQHNNGYRSVPTILFPDGEILVEPSSARLREKLADLDLIPAR